MGNEPRASRGAWFRQPDEDGANRRLTIDKALKPHEREALGSWHWEIWARDEQLPPEGEWRVWLIRAGRGFGKTRAGAEWVRNVARHDAAARIALVGASLAEVRAVMVEGESGVLESAPGALPPDYEPSLRRLQWPNGAQAFLYSSAEPDSLRGSQHSHAWCDEIAKWENSGGRAISAWDNLQLGMRLGEHPRVLATTTPRQVPPRGQLAVRISARWNAHLRCLGRAGDVLSGRVERRSVCGRTEWWKRGGCRSAHGDKRPDRRAGQCRDLAGQLGRALSSGPRTFAARLEARCDHACPSCSLRCRRSPPARP